MVESERLFSRTGEVPNGGPDKFLLSVLGFTRAVNAKLLLVGVGNVAAEKTSAGRRVATFALWPNTASRLRNKLTYIAELIRFFWEVLRFKPTKVLCGFEGIFALASLWAANISGAEFVFLGHCALAIESTKPINLKANRALCRGADLLIVHGPFVHDQAIFLGADASRIVEWNNGLDAEHLQYLKTLGGHSGGNSVLYIGRIDRDKGVFDLLAAFGKLQQRNRLKLQFVGTGPALEELRQAVSAEGYGAQVEVIGHVPFETIFEIIGNAAVVVTPTRSCFGEGLCQSVIESFYAGRPVIAPDFGPFPYIVDHEQNGLLFRRDSVESLTEALDRYFRDHDLRGRLEAGAVAAGRQHMMPELTFNEALGKVFS